MLALTIQLPEKLVDQLQLSAHENCRSLNDEVRFHLMQAIKIQQYIAANETDLLQLIAGHYEAHQPTELTVRNNKSKK